MKRCFDLTNNASGRCATTSIDNSWPPSSDLIDTSTTLSLTPESKRRRQSSNTNFNDSGLGTSRCLSSPSFDQQRIRSVTGTNLSPLLSTPTDNRVLRSSPSNMYIDSTPSPLRSFYMISPSAPMSMFSEVSGSTQRYRRNLQLTNPEKAVGFRITGSHISSLSSSSNIACSNENRCNTSIQHRYCLSTSAGPSTSQRNDATIAYTSQQSAPNAPETPSKCFRQTQQTQHDQFPEDSSDIFATFTKLTTSTPLRDDFTHTYLQQSLDAIKTEDIDHFYQENDAMRSPRNLISSSSSSMAATMPRTPTSFKKVYSAIERQQGRINTIGHDNPCQVADDIREILTSDTKRSSARSLIMPNNVDDTTVNFNMTSNHMIDFDATVDYSTNMFCGTSSRSITNVDNRRRPDIEQQQQQLRQFHFKSPVKRPSPMSKKWLKIVCGRTRLQQEMTKQARLLLGLITID